MKEGRKEWREYCESLQFSITMKGSILIVLMLVRAIACFGCPNHCFCYEWRNLLKTECVRKNLFNTFVGFSHETQVLDLSYNVLTILHGNEFQDANLRLLQDLRISNNRLHEIDKLSFNGLELLQNLDLSFNAIEYLAPTTFKYNLSLKTLNISHNPLKVTKDGPFLFSPSLQVLDIAYCKLEYLTEQMFLKSTQLETLNVSRNYIQKIKPELVDNMKNLKYLDVSKNDLPCNEETAVFLQKLISRMIKFKSFCRTSQNLMMVPGIQTEINSTEDVLQKEYENVSDILPNKPNLLNDATNFFKSIPSAYVLLGGIHVGILIGAVVTYLCKRKAKKFSASEINEKVVVVDSDSNQLTLAFVPLNTPPGTPPSPYHSRILPNFQFLNS